MTNYDQNHNLLLTLFASRKANGCDMSIPHLEGSLKVFLYKYMNDSRHDFW